MNGLHPDIEKKQGISAGVPTGKIPGESESGSVLPKESADMFAYWNYCFEKSGQERGAKSRQKTHQRKPQRIGEPNSTGVRFGVDCPGKLQRRFLSDH